MARDGSGNYSLPAGNPVTTGTTVSSTTHNTTMTDVANAITASIAKDGQTTPTANLPMGTYKHTGVGSGTARDQYASVGQLQDGGAQYLGSVTGVDTITASLTPAITEYATGMEVVLPPAGTNTGAVTLALNGLAAKSVLMPDGNQLLPADLRTGVPVSLIYNGTAFVVNSVNHVAGTFTVTMTGVTGSVTGTASYVRSGRMVMITIPSLSGTSNANTFALNGVPTACRTNFDQWVSVGNATDNGSTAAVPVTALVRADGAISLSLAGSTTGWTSSGTKGIATSTLSYVA